MSEQYLHKEATAFFDAFVAAFSSFDGVQVVARYAVPGLAIRGDGNVQVLQSRPDLEAFFQQVLDTYHRDGCRACRYRDLAITPIGNRGLLGAVTWDLLRADGSVLKSWRQSYNLAQTSEGWRIVASTEHLS